MTLEDIGSRHGIHRETVRQILQQSVPPPQPSPLPDRLEYIDLHVLLPQRAVLSELFA